MFFFSSTSSSLAAPPVISGAPSAVEENQGFMVNVNLTINSSANEKKYLRVAFSHPDTPTKYFGYTKNHFDTWYNGTPTIDPRQYKEVTMDAFNTWAGVVEAKPDPADSDYKGPGNYNFKIGYYTETGTSIVDWSSSVQITINASSIPTPTPTPTPTPNPTPSPTPIPTSTPSPTSSTKTPIPTPEPKATGVDASLVYSTKKSNANLVLGVQESQVVESTESGASTTEEGSDQGKKPFLAVGLIALGTVFLGIAGYAFLRERSSGRIKDLDEKIS